MIQRDYKDTNFLTSLRAIAIFLVFLIHSGGGGLRELGSFANSIVDMGKYGVEIFFVISGYTIFSQFFSEKHSISKFLLIRVARISIPYFPIILIVFVFIGIGGYQFNYWAIQFNAGKIDLLNLIAHVLYISPYNLNWQNTIIGIEWTLGIEVFYYVVLGLLIHMKLLSLRWRSFITFFAIFLLLAFSQRLLTKYLGVDQLFLHWTPMGYGYMFLFGGFAFFLRTLLATQSILTISKPLLSDIVLLSLGGVFMVLPIMSRHVSRSADMNEISFVLGTFLVVTFFSNTSTLARILNNNILTFFGSISYSFYLIHYIVIMNLPKFGHSTLDFLMQLVCTTLVSFTWYYIFEKIIYGRVKMNIKKMNIKKVRQSNS